MKLILLILIAARFTMLAMVILILLIAYDFASFVMKKADENDKKSKGVV